MKNTRKARTAPAFGFAAIAVAIVVSMAALLTGCSNPTDSDPGKPPVNNLTAKSVTIAAIPGVTAPETGKTPVTAITPTDQYTGTVTWSPAVSGAFAAKTVYTATITLTVKADFTLQGVKANFFTVAEATSVSNAANTGVITAVFPSTGGTAEDPDPITMAAISVSIPETGKVPVTTITETAQYTGTVAWNGNPSTFASETVYTATITLAPKTGFTLTGVAANFFTVAGASATNAANSGVITAVFPKTGGTASNPDKIDIAAIPGITPPFAGKTPVTTPIDTAQYTGTFEWFPNDATFQATSNYLAIITLTAKTGYTFQGVTANFFTVEGAESVTNDANSGIVTANFNPLITIDEAAIYGVTAPEGGATPVTTIGSSASKYTGTIVWEPAVSGTFAYLTEYTATITLTAVHNSAFNNTLQGVPANFFTVAGATSVSNAADSGVVTAVFPATGPTPIYGISLDAPAAHTFTNADVGYTALPSLTVTVTNTGDRATGALTAALSGTNPGSFSLSPSSIGSIAVSATGSFTVAPAAGLAVNTYTATVTVSGSNGITAGFNVSFTVDAAAPYIITGSGTSFTATKNSATIGTAGQPIQTVINAIKTHAAGNPATIQFGDGSTTLNIGSNSASFNTTDGTWGAVTLTGKITSTSSNQTILIANTVSVTSTADIANNSSGVTVSNDSTGTVIISGGTVSSTSSTAVKNNSTGTVIISGGTVSTAATNNAAVINASTGKITVSGTATVTSANTETTYAMSKSPGTIYLGGNSTPITAAVQLEILGGRVENTSSGAAIKSASGGAIAISGGTVSSATGYAVDSGTGKITVSGTATITSASEISTINISALIFSGSATAVRLEISGGTVENTSTTYGTAITSSGGITNISGGVIQVTAATLTTQVSRALYIGSNATVTISGGTLSTAAAGAWCQTVTNQFGKLTITGGTITAPGGYVLNCAVGYGSTSTTNISGATITGGIKNDL